MCRASRRPVSCDNGYSNVWGPLKRRAIVLCGRRRLEHRHIGALADRWHQMRGIAKQSDSIGQGMTVSSQAANRAVNSGSTRTTGRQGRLGPWMGVEWNATTGDPIRVGVKGKVDADTTLGVALGHQAASIREHPERAPANHFRDLGMRTVDVPDAQLDHVTPVYSGRTSVTSGRTREWAPSAPTSRSQTSVLSSSNSSRCRPSGNESSKIRRSTARSISGRRRGASSGVILLTSIRPVRSAIADPRPPGRRARGTRRPALPRVGPVGPTRDGCPPRRRPRCRAHEALEPR
jgi:hypothetical protein